MGKGKFTSGDDNEFPSGTGLEDVYENTKEDRYEATQEGQITPILRRVILYFNQDRKKELHIDGVIYIFYGRGSSVSVPRSVLTHPDFQSQAKYFIVKEN